MPMLRLRSYAFAVSLAACAAIACAAQTVQGLLPQLVPWPAMTWAVPATELELGASPDASLLDLNLPAGAMYGILPVGSVGVGVVFSVTPGEPPRLLIDTDGDSSLADEVGGYCVMQNGARSFCWAVTVLARYANGEGSRLAPCRVLITTRYDYGLPGYRFHYSVFCQRQGLVNLGDRLCPIALCTLRHDGRYDDLSSLIVVIDANEDGVLDDLPGSPDVFSASDTLQVGGRLFAIETVAPDGQSITLQEAGTAHARPAIARDLPAPLFETVALDGTNLSLSQLRGSCVVLDFLPAWAGSSCATCAGETSRPLARLRDVCALLDGTAADLVVILEGELPPDAPTGPNIAYVQDPEVEKLYRRTYGLLVIDPAGVIRALDEAWAEVQGDLRIGHLDELDAFDVFAVADRYGSE